jgi:hypothetical protein
MKLLSFVIIFSMSVFFSCVNDNAIVWNIDNLEKIGGHDITVLGDPQVIETPAGPAVEFDGEDDAIILDMNPLAGFSKFTVEIIFRPDSGGNKEQRFFHIGEVNDDRVLIETRLTEDNKWFLDTFIKSGESERTLYAQDFLHPLNEWYHAALVYDGQNMRHFVNGLKELEGSIENTPMKGGQTSLGVRLNRIYWFKGAIRMARIIPRALSPEEFMSF